MADTLLRLITLNSWKGDGNYSKRVELMAKGLKELQPDFVCLQESLRANNPLVDTAGYLGRELDLEVTFGPGRFKMRCIEGDRRPCYSGLAILSRFSPLTSKLTPLLSCAGDPDRTYLSAFFDWHGQPVTITNVHLTHLAKEKGLREKQLQTVLIGTNLFSEKAPKLGKHDRRERALSFCCGDFNWEVGDADILNLQTETGVLLQDCYVKGGGSLPGYTFGFEEGSPSRIDYIFNLSQKDDQEIIYHNAKVILARRDEDGLSPSDHLGVMVEIELG